MYDKVLRIPDTLTHIHPKHFEPKKQSYWILKSTHKLMAFL